MKDVQLGIGNLPGTPEQASTPIGGSNGFGKSSPARPHHSTARSGIPLRERYGCAWASARCLPVSGEARRRARRWSSRKRQADTPRRLPGAHPGKPPCRGDRSGSGEGTTSDTIYTINSDTSITATSPAGSVGQVYITVTNESGTSSTGTANQYSYDTTPSVTSISPMGGKLAGGDSVTIHGTGLAGTTGVKFGATSAQSYTAVSDTSL